MSLYYKPHSETQPLNPTLGERSHNGLTQTRTRRRVRIKKILPYIGIAAVLILIVFAAVVVFLSSGHTFRKPLSKTDPELYYSNVASQELSENLNSRSTSAKNVDAGCEATVMIMRHCEPYFARTDKNKNEYCGYLGMERANYLATLFGDVTSVDQPARWPEPYQIFAMSPQRPGTDHHNYQQADTMQPLAEKIGVMVDTKFTSGDEFRLAKQIFKNLRRGKICGRFLLISWSHEIPKLAQQLGCGPYNGCPFDYTEFTYDTAYQIKFVYNSPEAAVEESYEEDSDGEEDDDDTAPIVGSTKSFFRHRNTKVEAWEAHGSVVHMNFDPLSFSAKAGDYPTGGMAAGGSWRARSGL